MKILFTIYLVLMIFTFGSLLSSEIDQFYPGLINICLKSAVIENTKGEIEIMIEEDFIHTPFEWLNDLAKEYQIINMTRKYYVQDPEWSYQGIYPMNIFQLETKDLAR